MNKNVQYQQVVAHLANCEKDNSSKQAQLFKILHHLSVKNHAAILCRLGEYYEWGYGTQSNFKKAEKYYKKSAKQGFVEAQYLLGFFYVGQGKYKKACKWYQKAAKYDNNALIHLAYIYENGKGVKKNFKRAFQYYFQAAKLGDAKAQNAIGYFYDKGLFVKQNFSHAKKWYECAAMQGYATALNNLGYLYAYGHGIKCNLKLAKKWYKLAILADSKLALFNLAHLYEKERKWKKAYQYYQLAAENGDKSAKRKLKKLKLKFQAA